MASTVIEDEDATVVESSLEWLARLSVLVKQGEALVVVIGRNPFSLVLGV